MERWDAAHPNVLNKPMHVYGRSTEASKALAELIEAGTIEQTFFGSDLGQINAPRPVEGMRMTIRLLLAMGYSDDEVRAMVSGNAARLVGLGHEAPALARSA